jgi:hypothetical protein
LVDDNKISLLLFTVHCLIANNIFELDDLLDLLIDESAFRFNEFLALFGGGIEETRVYLAATM